jgi:anthranilate synthase component 1
VPAAFALRVPAALVYDHTADRAFTLVEAGREALQHRLAGDLAAAAPIPVAGSPEVASILGGLELEEEQAQRFGVRVDAALEHIRAGDIYQANLSRGWRAALDASCAPAAISLASATLYERLRTQNAAPFAALAQFQGWRALCSSPERLVRVRGGHVETRPIAGTRPRSRIAGADQRELAALIAHPKERAEHVMLVDLERNDLGRICRPGSVRADEFMTTESYAHVHHIVSNVCGELSAGLTPVDVLRAVFPGGSITGCPKFRCMQIIAALEGEARGAYTGALGFINHDGSMDFNILIRTITMNAEALEFRTGAGIVADSDWQLELQETRAKARGLIAALQSR